MRYFHGIKFGGLQQKIFNLMLIFMIAIIGVYVATSVVLQKKLVGIVEDTNDKQQSSIVSISEATMHEVLNSSMTKTTALQAYIADDLFNEVRSSVLTLQTYAKGIFENKDEYKAHSFNPPVKENDGIPSVQVQHEQGVDPTESEALGLVANMSEVMLSMFVNVDSLSSCFVATPDGCILFVDDRSGAYVDENGNVYDFEVRERPWYKRAIQEGELFFTGVEADAFTDILGLVCAAPVYVNGDLVAVVGADIFLSAISDYVKSTSNENGFVCVINENGQVLFSPVSEGVFKANRSDESYDLTKSENTDLASFVTSALSERTALTLLKADGKDYYLTGAPMPTVGWAVVSAVEKDVADLATKTMLSSYESINQGAFDTYKENATRSSTVVLSLTAAIIVLALVGALFLVSRIVKPLEHMTKRINALTGQDNTFEMEKVYETNDEIQMLAESFAELSTKTRDYISKITEITAEKERIGTELELATRIQADMLPNTYPAFPDKVEFDIYASMDPAREVGGDFYDYFLVDDDHLCMLIADVSGKGIPAALFMMASRIILASNAKLGKSAAEILSDANDAICQNNREEMFVTVWLGILEISTGKLTCANAGHEYPVVMHANGKYEIVKDKHGVVIGGMSGIKYKQYELQMEPGAKLFVYTDGVPEASNASKELFGMNRLLKTLNENTQATPEQLLKNIRVSVDKFVDGAEQFDDLTMLSMEYKGAKNDD